MAQGLYADLTPNELTFTGRRGTTYTATWDPETYEMAFATPDNTFPWDWIGFVGPQGAVALNGYTDIADTFIRVDPAALAHAQPGDLIRVKGRGVLGLAHVTKLGLIIGEGAGAQRAWFSEGNIDEYIVAPHYVGFQANVLGRTATVRITNLNPQDYYSVCTIEVSLDDAADARLLLASDLEPTMDYNYAVEFYNRTDTWLSFDTGEQALVGTQDGSLHPVYVYSDQPLHSWSGNNLTFQEYLSADVLDGQLHSSGSDGRAAISVVAQPVQHFYIGSQVLDSVTRADPSGAWDALRATRVAQLDTLPTIDSLSMPNFKFVNLFSNLILTYLINANGGLFYTDKAFLYATDAIMPALVTPHLLPPQMIAAFEDGFDLIASQQWASPVGGQYSRKLDTRTWAPLPDWYAGNLPDLLHFRPDGTRYIRENYCDVYGTAGFLNGLYSLYQVTGDPNFALSHQETVNAALSGLQAFDSTYDGQWTEDGNLFPNLLMPMSDLGMIAGEYPGESAQTIYAYQDAAELLRLYGQDAEADALIADYVVPMSDTFDSTFWNSSLNFYAPIADRNSQTHETPGTFYQDRWAHTMFVPLRGDLGQNRLAQMLTVFTGPDFYEPEGDVHWLAKGDENFATIARWQLPQYYTNGWGMEGGFLLLPNAISPLGYYQLEQSTEAEYYANIYFDRWTHYGPYEVSMEYDYQMPGRFGASSLYIESASGTTWLLQTALGLEVDGTNVTIDPRLSGQFVVRDLHITSLGMTAIINYARDVDGIEHMEIVSNEGLNISAPGTVPTHAQLASFTATGSDDHVQVEWETASEIDTLGFHLYRSDSTDGPLTRLNESLIPSQVPGSPTGATYIYKDTSVLAGVRYYYTLEDVNTQGVSIFHGPVTGIYEYIHTLYLPMIIKGQ